MSSYICINKHNGCTNKVSVPTEMCAACLKDHELKARNLDKDEAYQNYLLDLFEDRQQVNRELLAGMR